MPATYTPIRFPGGKSKLYPTMSEIISLNDLNDCTYIEPFAGGAGLAMKLLALDEVSSVILNDLDRAVYAMWYVFTERTDEICAFVEAEPLDVDTWLHHREIYRNADEEDLLKLGLSSFYLNRTNRSGVLTGGLIGGLGQSGKYKMDARFNRKNLVRQIERVASLAPRITVHNLDASDFIKQVVPESTDPFVYFDPPYVDKGACLYRNSFAEKDHEALAESITDCEADWIVTYDSCELIHELYKGFRQEEITIGYSAARIKAGRETLVYCDSLIPTA